MKLYVLLLATSLLATSAFAGKGNVLSYTARSAAKNSARLTEIRLTKQLEEMAERMANSRVGNVGGTTFRDGRELVVATNQGDIVVKVRGEVSIGGLGGDSQYLQLNIQTPVNYYDDITREKIWYILRNNNLTVGSSPLLNANKETLDFVVTTTANKIKTTARRTVRALETMKKRFDQPIDIKRTRPNIPPML